MATEHHKNFIDGLCALAQIPHARLFYDSADLIVDGIGFTLIDASAGPENALAFYCDFGAPPLQNRSGVLERLLQVNLALHGINTPQFAMNSETGHILLSRRVPIAALTPLQMMNVLGEHAAHAKEWRAGYYLQDQKKPSLAAGGGKRHLFGL